MTNLLLIEDNDQVRDIIHQCLETEPYVIHKSNSGLGGLALYQQKAIDIVLLDLFLPDKDGLEIIKAIRKMNPRAKIIAMSGGFQKGEIDILGIAKRLGAATTLSKPFSMEELLAVVKHLVSNLEGDREPNRS